MSGFILLGYSDLKSFVEHSFGYKVFSLDFEFKMSEKRDHNGTFLSQFHASAHECHKRRKNPAAKWQCLSQVGKNVR